MVAVLPLAMVVRRRSCVAREQSVVAASTVQVPWRPIIMVGLALVLFYMVDTAAFTWGPQYLDQVFDTPSDLVALAMFPYLLASGRCGSPATTGRRGTARSACCASAAVVAFVALAIIVFAPTWPVAVLGFTHPGRRRRRGGAAELLRGRPDRRRATSPTRPSARPGWTP